MKRRKSISLAALFVAMLALPVIAGAQDQATPPADPLEYDDPAMHYAAPQGAKLVGDMEHPTLATLSQDPTPVARWVIGSQQDIKVISIVMELYSGSLDGFETTYADELRSDDSSTLVKTKEAVMLQNGMPAMFLDVTQGSGFDTHKIYAYLWIDSQRAVILSVEAMLGYLDADQAKRLLAGATAVRYPMDQP
jgi:hypothetical protein